MSYYFDVDGLDPNGNASANNFIPSYTTTATAAGTTTLTVASTEIQRFTGATTQTVVLPVVSTLPKTGFGFWIVNDSSGALTVNSSGGNLVATITGGNRLWAFAILLTGTSAASWDTANVGGYLNIPSNAQSAAYTTVLADSGKSIDHPASDNNARTFTIDSNANVPYPVGTCISFSNMDSNAVTIAITSDTMYLSGAGTTGSRTLAQYGTATARKLTSTTWLISGVNLT